MLDSGAYPGIKKKGGGGGGHGIQLHLSGGFGGMHPRNFVAFSCSEIASGAV